MNEINNSLQDVIPIYDLRKIIIDYYDDTFKNNLKNVLNEFEEKVIIYIEDWFDDNDFCMEPGRYYQNQCGYETFKEMKNKYPECYYKHIKCLDKMVNNGQIAKDIRSHYLEEN